MSIFCWVYSNVSSVYKSKVFSFFKPFCPLVLGYCNNMEAQDGILGRRETCSHVTINYIKTVYTHCSFWFKAIHDKF